jgi:hypothetical protein
MPILAGEGTGRAFSADRAQPPFPAWGRSGFDAVRPERRRPDRASAEPSASPMRAFAGPPNPPAFGRDGRGAAPLQVRDVAGNDSPANWVLKQ